MWKKLVENVSEFQNIFRQLQQFFSQKCQQIMKFNTKISFFLFFLFSIQWKLWKFHHSTMLVSWSTYYHFHSNFNLDFCFFFHLQLATTRSLSSAKILTSFWTTSPPQTPAWDFKFLSSYCVIIIKIIFLIPSLTPKRHTNVLESFYLA